MKGIPFTAYDVFAYLSSGFFVIGAADYAFPGKWLLDASLNTAHVFLWIVVAYVLGHAIAQVSATVLEKGLVKRGLGYPTTALFGTAGSALKWLFPGYFEPLPGQIRDLVRKNAETDAGITDDSALFMYCDARGKKDEETAAVLTVFLSMYGFARNVCVAAAVAAVLLLAGAIAHHENWETKAWLAGGAAVIAVFLLYRYLKFFRVYALEMFSAYAAGYPASTGSS